MRPGLGRSVLRRRGLLQDAPEAIGREIQLHQRHAAVECFGIPRDQVALEPEAADPVEQHGPACTFRQPRGVAEPEPGVADSAVADGVEEFLNVVAAGVVKVLQHRGDRSAPPMRTEKSVFVDAIRREQHRQQ
jgi:hypothetical protein